MTGEITLTGQVLQIGGVRDKVLAAQRAGLKTVILPQENEADLVELPEETREEMTFVLADTIDEVLDAALDGARPPRRAAAQPAPSRPGRASGRLAEREAGGELRAGSGLAVRLAPAADELVLRLPRRTNVIRSTSVAVRDLGTSRDLPAGDHRPSPRADACLQLRRERRRQRDRAPSTTCGKSARRVRPHAAASTTTETSVVRRPAARTPRSPRTVCLPARGRAEDEAVPLTACARSQSSRRSTASSAAPRGSEDRRTRRRETRSPFALVRGDSTRRRMRRPKGRGTCRKTTEKVAAMAGTAKPYVERALHDEELREHVEAGLRRRQGRSTTS